MTYKYDAIIVGAGPAGLSAAYTMAKAGLQVVIIERGDYPGAKNVMGGVLYSKMMDDIVPGFWKDAPLERAIIEQNFWLMGKDSVVKMGYRGDEWSREPYNNFTVFRAKFDKWFADQCVKQGALLINETVVEELIIIDNKVVGVKTGRPEGDLLANVVVIADGVNSLLAKQLGLHDEWDPAEVALAVMEEIKLPSEAIESRFNLEKGQGTTIEVFGDGTIGMVGTAFIYTNKEHLSIGCGALLSQVRKERVKPYELLEYFKNHKMIKPLIYGGETVEYYAHLIPEGGYRSIPKIYGDGYVVCGDAAQLVNGIHREGSNLAMKSGQLAAEAIIRAKEINDFSERILSHYYEQLEESFVIQDLKKYKNASHLLEKNPSYFNEYIPMANYAMSEIFTVDGYSKREKQKKIMNMMKHKKSRFTIGKDIYNAWRSMK